MSTFPFRLRDLRSPAATQRLSLGCPHLDALLGGGIPVGCLTEVVGEATAGKTQLCLRLLLTAQLPQKLGGLDGSALWLCSEKGDPPVRRLAQLAKGGGTNNSASAASAASHAAPSTDDVFVEKGLATPAELMEALDRMEPLMMMATEATDATANDADRDGIRAKRAGRRGKRRIRLVVVDSIAALFRDAAAATDIALAGAPAAGGKELGGAAGRQLYAARATALFAVAARLRRLADDHSLAVVVVNQVTDVISDGIGEDTGGLPSFRAPPHHHLSSLPRQRRPLLPAHTAGLRLFSSGREVAPALGLAWASCVGIRLFLSRAAPVGSSSFGVGGGNGDGDGENIVPGTATTTAATRRLQVVFAPHLPSSSCWATLDERGLVGVVAEGEGERQKRHAAAAPVVVVCSGVFAAADGT